MKKTGNLEPSCRSFGQQMVNYWSNKLYCSTTKIHVISVPLSTLQTLPTWTMKQLVQWPGFYWQFGCIQSSKFTSFNLDSNDALIDGFHAQVCNDFDEDTNSYFDNSAKVHHCNPNQLPLTATKQINCRDVLTTHCVVKQAVFQVDYGIVDHWACFVEKAQPIVDKD